MAIYLDTRGNSVLSVGICDRCNRKFAYTELMPDPNFPGMRVCKDDLDQYDPWRLPALQTENIALRFPRPDVSIALTPNEVLTESGFTTGNSVLIEGRPPAGGNTGDLSTQGSPNNPLLPTITMVSPDSGSISGGTSVLITGTNFTTGMTFKFGNLDATSVLVLSPFQARAVTPSNSNPGYVNVKAITAFGSGTMLSAYRYI